MQDCHSIVIESHIQAFFFLWSYADVTHIKNNNKKVSNYHLICTMHVFPQKSQKYIFVGFIKSQLKQGSSDECGHFTSWMSLKPFIDVYKIHSVTVRFHKFWHIYKFV